MTTSTLDDHAGVFASHRAAVAAATALYVTVFAALLLATNDTVRAAVQDADTAWWRLMLRVDWWPLVAISRILDVLGGTVVTLPVRVGVAAWLGWRRRWAALVTWLGVIAVSELFITVLKAAYGRPRPAASLVETTGFAFPSGHAVAGTATALALVLVFLPPGAHRRVWEMRAAAFAVLMGLSRTLLRAHWLSDAVVGVALGAATAIGVAALVAIVRRRRHAGPPPAADPPHAAPETGSRRPEA